jgi:hypothetical protein
VRLALAPYLPPGTLCGIVREPFLALANLATLRPAASAFDRTAGTLLASNVRRLKALGGRCLRVSVLRHGGPTPVATP